MKCICNNGKMTIKVHDFSTEECEEKSVEIDCIWCNGTGEMTPEQAAEKQAFEDSWCKCGNPSGQVNYYQEGHSHGYTCADCGKIVQTG